MAIRITERQLTKIVMDTINEMTENSQKEMEKQLSWSEIEHKQNRAKDKANFEAGNDEYNAKTTGKSKAANPNIHNNPSVKKTYSDVKESKARRITQSQLVSMIDESVKSVLAELDWKTYANAAQKAGAATERGKKFNSAAQDEFATTYGYNRKYTDYAGNEHSESLAYNPKLKAAIAQDFSSKPAENGKTMDSQFEYNPKNEEGSGEVTVYHKGSPEISNVTMSNDPVGINPDSMDDIENAQAEIDNYYNDNYEYQNGEGWKLKESVSRIVKHVISDLKKNK